MKTKKRTFWRNMLCILIKDYRWRQNPKNIEQIIYQEQMLHQIGWV